MRNLEFVFLFFLKMTTNAFYANEIIKRSSVRRQVYSQTKGIRYATESWNAAIDNAGQYAELSTVADEPINHDSIAADMDMWQFPTCRDNS